MEASIAERAERNAAITPSPVSVDSGFTDFHLYTTNTTTYPINYPNPVLTIGLERQWRQRRSVYPTSLRSSRRKLRWPVLTAYRTRLSKLYKRVEKVVDLIEGIIRGSVLLIAGLCVLGVQDADAQEREHALVLEIGPAGEWPFNDKPNFGGTFAIEATPIENWLEIEMGLTSLATAGRSEISGDVLFKKPFRVSPTFEFMIGAGPSISETQCCRKVAEPQPRMR